MASGVWKNGVLHFGGNNLYFSVQRLACHAISASSSSSLSFVYSHYVYSQQQKRLKPSISFPQQSWPQAGQSSDVILTSFCWSQQPQSWRRPCLLGPYYGFKFAGWRGRCGLTLQWRPKKVEKGRWWKEYAAYNDYTPLRTMWQRSQWDRWQSANWCIVIDRAAAVAAIAECQWWNASVSLCHRDGRFLHFI